VWAGYENIAVDPDIKPDSTLDHTPNVKKVEPLAKFGGCEELILKGRKKR